MHGSTFSTHRIAALAATVALACLLMSGCAGMGGGKSELSADKLAQAAGKAWDEQDFQKSELFYSRLVQRSDVAGEARLTSLQRLAYSAATLGHYHEASFALETWAKEDPKAETDWRWQKLYVDTLIGLGRTAEAEKHLAIIRIRKDLPEKVRLNAGMQLAALYRRDNAPGKSLEALAALYDDTPSAESRAFLEQQFVADLDRAGASELDGLAAQVSPDNQLRFPYALVSFERARKLVESDPGQWASVWPTMRRIASSADLADKSRLQSVVGNLESRLGPPQTGFAMALPLSGPYAQVGWKILRGAGAAQWELAKAGSSVDVIVINTDRPGWTRELAELPPNYRVVGGPLQSSALEAAEKSGAMKDRIPFAFMSDLGDLREGVQAWRFFGSPQDQLGALIEFCVGQMNINSFGVISPNEHYGKRMAEIFRQEAARKGGHVTREVTYPPGDHPAWGEAVRKFLDVRNGVGAENAFRAVFMPDSLSQASLLIPHFFFYEENRMLILGPSMWNQALESGGEADAKYFDISVFPGAWRSDSDGAAMLARVMREQGLGHPDFWVALGYDFVRFAAGLGSFKATDPADVNARLAGASDMEFSLAPIVWSPQGVASQKVYLFTPGQGGAVPANAADLLNNIQAAEDFRKQRIQVIKDNR